MTETAKHVKRSERHKILTTTQHPKRLRRARTMAGLTLAQLGERAGYSKQHLSELELGIKSASPPCLLALARALGREVADLMPAEDAAA